MYQKWTPYSTLTNKIISKELSYTSSFTVPPFHLLSMVTPSITSLGPLTTAVGPDPPRTRSLFSPIQFPIKFLFWLS